MTPPLNARELCRALGISEATYYRLKARGEFRRFELTQPIGQKRYSAEKVAAFLAGGSLTQFRRTA